MESLHNVSAEKLMNTEPFTVEKTSNIKSVKASMEEKGLKAVPVEHDGKYIGVISYRELIRHAQFSDSTKLSKVIHEAPEFEASDSLVDLARLRINSGRKLLVKVQNEKLEAVVGDEEFLNISSRIKEFENYSTRNLATHELVQAFEDDSIEKVRHMMLDNSISRVPVLDSEGRLEGIVRSTDLLRTVAQRESQDPGGTSGKSLKDTHIAGGGEKESMSDIDVGEVMNRTPVEIEGFSDAVDAVEKMVQKGSKDVIITESGYPEAILTVKDLVDYISDQGMDNFVLVNLVGLEVEEEKAAVHEQVRKQVRGSLGRKAENLEEISLHIKKSEKDGKRHRYEVNAKLYSEHGITTSNVEEWDLMEAVDKVLDELDAQLRKRKGKASDH
ncbi:MAG: CBS domain-containing protein [Candidatus Nanohaloarchaea archaeon]